MTVNFDPFPNGAPDDAVQGVYSYLLGFEDVVSVLGASDSGVPFLYNGNVYHTMAGTSSCAVVVKDGSGWAAPNIDNTAQFPRIQIEVWSDPPRDLSGQVTTPTEARTRAYAVYQRVNSHLHIPYSKVLMMGSVLTFGSVRLGAPAWLQRDDSDHVGKLTVFYGISMIESGLAVP